MNRQDAALYLPLVQALAEGKTLQYRPVGEDIGSYKYPHGKWTDVKDDDVYIFRAPPNRLRVKPEPVVIEKWSKLYANGDVGLAHASKASALERIQTSVIGLVHITITDGVPHAEILPLTL